MRPAPPKKTPPRTDLREACVRAARDVIAKRGVEQLSLRDVARRLGVSHQAPYRHYASRDHLLAEVIRRSLESFARHLDGRPAHDDPEADLASLGARYLEYAAAHPLEYRLMFATPWPEPAMHAGLWRDAVRAFDILRGVLRRMHGARAPQRAVDLDAMFVWSNMHGLVSIAHSEVIDHLALAPGVGAATGEHVMRMMSLAMAASRRAKRRGR